MNKVVRIGKLIIGMLGALINLVSKFILQVLILVLTPVSQFFRNIIDKIHLSITFKLNLVYGISYSILFFIAYRATIVLYLQHIEKAIPEAERLISFKILIGVLMCIFLIVLLVVGKLATRGIKQSVKSMNETIKHIDANQLTKRIDISGTKDELKDLAGTFNKMMDTLEGFVDSQKQFVSDASHELRTPIAVIQGYANLLNRWGSKDPSVLEESIEAIKEEAENMQQLVEKLLFLARADKNTQVVKLEPVNISQLAKDIVKHTRLIDDTHDIKEVIEDDVTILGDTSLLKELLRIFIDNAIKYTPEEGIIRVVIKRSGKNAIMSIQDNGVGITKEHLPYIFDRFYQEDEARTHKKSSSGLGLAIAKWIIETHKGKVYVNSILGEGTEVVVFFDYNEPSV